MEDLVAAVGESRRGHDFAQQRAVEAGRMRRGDADRNDLLRRSRRRRGTRLRTCGGLVPVLRPVARRAHVARTGGRTDDRLGPQSRLRSYRDLRPHRRLGSRTEAAGRGARTAVPAPRARATRSSSAPIHRELAVRLAERHTRLEARRLHWRRGARWIDSCRPLEVDRRALPVARAEQIQRDDQRDSRDQQYPAQLAHYGVTSPPCARPRRRRPPPAATRPARSWSRRAAGWRAPSSPCCA